MNEEEYVANPEGSDEIGAFDIFKSYLEGEPDSDNPDEEQFLDEDEKATVEDEPSEEAAEAEEGEEPEAEAEAEPEEITADEIERPVTLPDGNKVTIKELVQGYFRQQDYTRKTQALAEQRRSLEQAAEAFQRQYGAIAEFASALERHPYLPEALAHIMRGDVESAAEVVEKGRVGMPSMPGAPVQVQDPRVDALLEAQTRKELERIDAQWKAIRERRPDLDPDKLLNELLDHLEAKGRLAPEEVDLEEAYRELYWDYELKKAQKQGERKATRQLKKGAKAPTSMRQPKAAEMPKPSTDGLSDAQRAAARYLELMREN